MKQPPRRLIAIAIVLCGAGTLAAAVALRGRWNSSGPPARPADPGGTADLRLAAVGPAARPTAPLLFQQTVTREGIAVEFSIQQLNPARLQAEELQEGDDVRIRFKIADTAGGRAARGLNPAAWLDLIPKHENRGARTCEQKAKAFVGGSIFGRAELDLNVFYVLTLNDEASLSVVDPLFGFGGTKLLNIVVLDGQGEDWALSGDETRVYVSLPEGRKVAVVDTAGWEVTRNIPLAQRPGRVGLSPDGRLLWVADADEDRASGITPIDTATLKPLVPIVTGHGRHELAFSDDGRWAFVTNGRDGTVAIVDTRSLTVVDRLPVGPRPVSVAFSPLAKMAYVSSADGAVTVVDGPARRVVARLEAEPGLGQIRFAPDGRLGFLVNPAKDVVHVLDAARNRIVQTATVEDEPDQVSFTGEFAYVRHRGSATVLMIPLKAVGVEGRPVQVFSFPGGQIAPGKAPRLSPADAVVQASGESGVLVANPMDKSVYLYKEGMAAPMGSFSNYGRQPRSVLVVDRSLKERRESGVYETVARLRRPGDYDVVFLLGSPRIVHCFSVAVRPNPALEDSRRAGKIGIEHLVKERRVPAGESARLTFRLTDQQTKAPITGLTDVEVLTNLMPGTWHKRHVASPQADGVYALDFAPPRPGLYYVYLQSRSRGLGFNNDQYLVLEAFDKVEQHEKD